MSNLTPYLDQYSYVNCNTTERVGFNAILFTAEYLLSSSDVDPAAHDIEMQIFGKTVPQILKGSVYFSTPEDTTYISLDNLTALSALSPNYAAKIYAETKRQWLRYDNLNPEKPSWSRIQQPRDIIFYGMQAGSWICWILSPIMLLFCFMSMFSSFDETSGKLLVWVRLYSLKQNLFMRIALWFFTLQLRVCHSQNWYDVVKIYFQGDEQHPVVLNFKRLYA